MSELAPIQCVIIVLGKSMVVQNDMVTLRTEHKARLTRAAGVFHRKAALMPASRLRILVTGYGMKQGLTEADAMRQYLIFHCSITPECILVENRSVVTTLNIWNAYFVIQHLCSQDLRAAMGAPDCNPLDVAQIAHCKQLTAPQSQLAMQYIQTIQSLGGQVRFPPECVLVTSDIHMPRARIMIQSIWAFLARECQVTIDINSIQYASSHYAAIFRYAGLHSYVRRTEVQKELGIDELILLNSINFNNQFPIIQAPDAVYSPRFSASQDVLNATIGPRCTLPWNKGDEPAYEHASCSVCFGFSHADDDLPVNIGALWLLVFHWDERYHTRWFDSRDNARQFMQDRTPRAARLLLSPNGLISDEHFGNDEWKTRIYSQAQRAMHSMQNAYGAFHANTTLSVSNWKFDCDTEPSSIQYPVGNFPEFRPANNSPSTQMLFEGGFTRYEGSTIIMLISAAALPLWQRFHQMLTNDDTVHAAMHILPPTSHHITLRGISEVRTARGSVLYNRNIVHAKFAKLVLLEQQFADTFGSRSIQFSPADGQLDRILSSHCNQLQFLSARDDSEEKVLRGFEQLVINELNLKNGSQQWHMTLGYWHINPKWTVTQREGAEMLYQRANSAIRTHYNNFIRGLTDVERESVLQFQRPRVCCYQSMAEFNYIPDL